MIDELKNQRKSRFILIEEIRLAHLVVMFLSSLFFESKSYRLV